MTSAAGELTVLTPFHRLALAARRAAYAKKPLEPREVQRLMREDEGRVVVWLALRGEGEDFARFYEPTLRAGSGEVRAAFVQNERTALREPDGRYLARCVYAFPTSRLRPTERVTLVVRTPDGSEVAQFAVDLGAMR